MKFTTASAAVAVAATGASAQGSSSWTAWSSSTPVQGTSTNSCPATLTAVTTTTTTAWASTSIVYEATVSVPIPTTPASVPVISPVWASWTSASTASPCTSLPAGCTAGTTVTSTSTVTSTVAGTTTVTGQTLFVGVQVTGNADASWAIWQPSSTSSAAGSAGTSGGAGGNWGGSSGSGTSGNNGNGGWGNGGSSSGSGTSGNAGWGNGGSDPNSGSGASGWNGWNSGSNNPSGSWGQGSWGGKGTGGGSVGSNGQVFQWDPPTPSNIKSVAAPQYTQNPDGSWSAPSNQGWADWPSSGSGSGSGSGNGGSNGNGGSGGNGGNGGSPSTNGTSPTNGTTPVVNSTLVCGGAGSNCTAPFPALAEVGCNDASNRASWCGGFSIDSDYYQNYFDQFNATYSNGNVGNYNGQGGFPVGGVLKKFDLVITNGTFNHDGTDALTFLINGQSPGPAIEVNWGDLVQITVHNNLQVNGTAIHWHGIRQVGTNDQDGVPGVTECAVAPGSSRTYTWRASSYGTSWYHSHYGLQYGDGIYGPIIIHGPATANYDVDAGPVLLGDTYGMSASAFGSIISHVGPGSTQNYLLNGVNTAADLSAGQHATWKVQAGKKYLFRFINSAAQNMYSVSIDQHVMQVIAADFVPIVPYTTSWLNIGIGQRYDVVVEMNQAVSSYFLRAVTQLACPSACNNTGLNQANGIIFYEGVQEVPLLLPNSTVNGNKTLNDFLICADEPLASLVPHLVKSAGNLSAFTDSAATLPGGSITKVPTSDDGLVFRWFLNNGAMYINYTQPTIQSISSGIALNSSVYANPIVLEKKNAWYYFVIQNQFFAYHPMHLHGHDFAVLGQGDGLFNSSLAQSFNFDNPIRRDTVMLRGAPNPNATTGGYTVIGFETDNPGAWLMHCHIAWHVDGGLALQWLERPDDMTASGFTSQDDFQEECSAYNTYQSSNPDYLKLSGESGLRRRELTYMDKWMNEASRQFNGVVRRDSHSHGAKHYLDAHAKRGFGDGAHRRTFGRRR